MIQKTAEHLVGTRMQMRKAVLKKEGLDTEISLSNPATSLLELIKEAGGRVLGERYVVWCHSDTCAHNSHAAGQDIAEVAIPSAWIVKNLVKIVDLAKVYDFDPRHQPLFIIPAEPDEKLVYVEDCRHYGEFTRIASPRVWEDR